MSDAAQIVALAEAVGRQLARRGWMLASAESCTAGGIAYAVTSIAGSSAWFDRGVVVYSNAAKTDLLAVPSALIEMHGAVSEPVAHAMAAGMKASSRAQIAVAVTGIAGPGGGSLAKPVGTVCFGWAADQGVDTTTVQFAGDRAAVRTQSIVYALRGVLNRTT